MISTPHRAQQMCNQSEDPRYRTRKWHSLLNMYSNDDLQSFYMASPPRHQHLPSRNTPLNPSEHRQEPPTTRTANGVSHLQSEVGKTSAKSGVVRSCAETPTTTQPNRGRDEMLQIHIRAYDAGNGKASNITPTPSFTYFDARAAAKAAAAQKQRRAFCASKTVLKATLSFCVIFLSGMFAAVIYIELFLWKNRT